MLNIFHPISTLRQKCPNNDFILVSIFLYSGWILNFTVNLRIQSEYRKILTRKNFVFQHFSSSANNTMHGQIQLTLCSKYLLNNKIHNMCFLKPWFHYICFSHLYINQYVNDNVKSSIIYWLILKQNHYISNIWFLFRFFKSNLF